MPAFTSEKEILPEFPSTPHLPHKPNTDKLDKVSSEAEVNAAFVHSINVEEKIDGASCGMTLHNEEPLIRNRNHILRKGYFKKGSAAKEQFGSVFNWFYENKEKFEHIAETGPYSVYGEWCIAQHGIVYNRLPSWFIAYDIYDHEKRLWLPPLNARARLEAAGFTVPALRFWGVFEGAYEDMELWANMPATWSDEKAEGIYVKAHDDKQITHRFKMVREDFVRGAFWNPKKFTRNKMEKAQ
jgi:hypothetical protein